MRAYASGVLQGEGIVETEHVTTSEAPAAARVRSGRTPQRVSGRVGLPDTLRTLQSTAGNRAARALVAARTPRPQQRPGGSPRAGRFDDYADLFNDVQALAAAAINGGGRGLTSYRLGRDLSAGHRDLLEDVRRTLIDGGASAAEARESAAADWRSISVRLRATLDEARGVGLPSAALAAVADDIAMIGERYLHVRPRGPGEAESPGDYADTVTGIAGLLDAFDHTGEASLGMGRENVPGRPDAAAGSGPREVNEHARERLHAVTLGEHMSTRHRALVEKLRTVMLLTRTETSGSAYRAAGQWASIKAELDHVIARAPRYADGDVGAIARRLDAFGGLVAQHYELVHTETLTAALKPGATAKRGEARLLDELHHMLEIIEHGLRRVPGRPGEWLLTSGSLQVRIRDDQAGQLRAVAAHELKGYMADIAKLMARTMLTYESVKHEGSFKLGLLGLFGGAADPGSQANWLGSVIEARDTIVNPLVDRGEFLAAFDVMVWHKGIVEQRVKQVAAYDADLDVGERRLGRVLQALQAALISLVPIAGEAAILSYTGRYAILAVAGTAGTAGAGATAIAEAGRELAFDRHLDAARIAATSRQGLALGLGAVGPAATKALGGAFSNVLGPGQGGVTAVIAESTASGTVGVAQSKMAGGPAAESFVASIAGHMAGLGVKGAGVSGPIGTTLGSAGASAFGAAVSGGDWFVGFVGGVPGTPGAARKLAEYFLRPRPGVVGGTGGGGGGTGGGGGGTGGGGGGTGGGAEDGIPVHVGPEGDATYEGTTPWMPPPEAAHLSVPALQRAIHDRILALGHGWANPNDDWLELMHVDREQLIAQYPQDRRVWDKVDEAWSIVRNPKKVENGIIKIYLGAAHERITPTDWLLTYFGGVDDMPILNDSDRETFRTEMRKAKPALDDTLIASPHGQLTHMFQEFLLAEEWGLAAAREFRQAIADVHGPPDASGKPMYSRVWDAVFDSFDDITAAINRPERLGPILHDNLGFPGRPDRTLP